MSKDRDTVTQCELVSGRLHHIAYIPQSMARLNNTGLIIDNMPGTWTVVNVYTTMSTAEANERSRDYTKQRDCSDI
jgi:hypothetical protein